MASRRGKVTAYKRRAEVLTLYAAGYDIDHIVGTVNEKADKEGLRRTSKNAVQKIIATQLERWSGNQPPEEIEKARALALERLDQMTRALWPRVKNGDPRAIDSALRIEERRARITGAELPVKHEHHHQHDHKLEIDRGEIDRAHDAFLTGQADVELGPGDYVEEEPAALLEGDPVPSA